MLVLLRKTVAFLVLLLFVSIGGVDLALGQALIAPPSKRHAVDVPKLFLDCNRCDGTYIRREITFVDYVRDPQQADVHVLVTDEPTGAGGREYVVELIGMRAFAGEVHRISFTTGPSDSWDEQRQALVRALKVGLVPFLLQTPMANRVSVDVAGGEQRVAEATNDPWNGWVFEFYGDGYANFEASRSALRTRYGVSANRVTEDWKIRLRPYFNYSLQRFESSEGTVESRSRRDGFDSFVIRSIDEHWSTGLFGGIYTSTFDNIDLRLGVSPAVEYSLFPYREASRRELTFVYRAGMAHVAYRDTTIFGKITELLVSEELEMNYILRQPWGYVNVGIEGSHYFHDLSKYRLEFDGGISVRLARGLSLHSGAEVDLIQDQLNLPRGDASFEEVLLRQRQLATSFEINASVGFRYTFGSIYNNVVNTRF